MSGMGAPFSGGLVWQVWQRVDSRACTSQGRPLATVPVEPPVPVRPPTPVLPGAPPVPVVVVVQVPAGVLADTQALMIAMSLAVGRGLVPRGGMGAAVFCMRDSARWAKVMFGSANDCAVRLA